MRNEQDRRSVIPDIRGSETILIVKIMSLSREMARQTLMASATACCPRVTAKSDGLVQERDPGTGRPGRGDAKTRWPGHSGTVGDRFDGIPILFTSGYSPDSQNLSGTVPGTRYLQKPIQPDHAGANDPGDSRPASVRQRRQPRDADSADGSEYPSPFSL